MTGALASAQQPARTKSPEAFRTISEVSAELDVPQHVLRFWETRFSQVRPVKRAGGRRFYRPEDVALLRGIRSLLYTDGYTIKGVQKVLRDKGWRFVAEIGRSVAQAGARPWHTLGDAEARRAHDGADVPSLEARVRDAFADDDAAPAGHPAVAALMDDDDAGTAPSLLALEEHKRVRLELLLAELLVMRDRLRSARPRA